MEQQLVLIVPATVSGDRLADALAGGGVAACVLQGGPRFKECVAAAQAGGAAALAEVEANGAPWPAPEGADGLHVSGPLSSRLDAVKRCPEGATVGVVAAARHEAMTLGEAGADYIWFGVPDTLSAEAIDQAIWWQALFEIPVVIAGPATEFTAMKQTGAEFIAVDVFGDPDPAARIAEFAKALRT